MSCKQLGVLIRVTEDLESCRAQHDPHYVEFQIILAGVTSGCCVRVGVEAPHYTEVNSAENSSAFCEYKKHALESAINIVYVISQSNICNCC